MGDFISGELSDDLKNSWSTDPDVFDAMNKEFNFCLDAAASKDNHKCAWYHSKESNALSLDWSDAMDRHDRSFPKKISRTVWINPPYGRGIIEKFMHKCIEQKNKGVTSVLLVPATLDAQWLPIHEISEIRIVTGGRLSFYHPITNKKINGNTKGSMFVIFRPSKMPISIRLIDRGELLCNH